MQRCISEEDNLELIWRFSIEKFRLAIFQMHPVKTPGSNGLNPVFYQNFCYVCGMDVYQSCCSWLNLGVFPFNLNDTNVVLILKVYNHDSMRDLRPISICNIVYKILAKVLANRMKRVIFKCISEEQSAFIEGRSIIENALIASEIIHYMKCKRR